ncbi:hypothetical protein F0562_020159 [Nyssa sinensis]|uniref:RWP-RK domain-containing protein n=1 Tax=Nyssa sinensis TaxID=561372 RepID=A0A5J5BQV7_9ASTE|nr:hypothetical protein F0562_020159 [Nyssa sinensis]
MEILEEEEEEPSSSESDYDYSMWNCSDFYEADIYFLLNKFKKEKLFWDRPTSEDGLWVLWNPTHTSCQPTPDSVGIEDKIRSALHKLSFGDFEDPMLIQFWAAVTDEGRCFLTTLGQPFGIYNFSENLCSYRNHSLEYKFFVDGESEEELGFPARVYRHKWPESTPNVQYYSTKQHPWCDRASDCKNLALLALAVFEASGNSCAGVLELVGDILFPYDIHKIDEALQAAHLKSLGPRWLCNHFDPRRLPIGNEGLQDALNEIREVLDVVCETHELPLAQTWVLCKDCNDGACSSFPNESPRIAFSKIYDAYYSIDIDGDLFFDATDVLHLQKDQGVVGRAYLGSHNTSFCRDITQFSITEYPMVHYARHEKLFGCFAICFNSSYNGLDKYILEFFLPRNKRFDEHPRPHILDKILATMNQNFPNLKTASGKPVGVELFIEEVSFSMVNKHDSLQICQNDRSLPRAEALQNGEDTAQVNSSDRQLIGQDDAIDDGKNIGSAEQSDTAGTNSGKKSTKREPEITYEDLQKNFGRKLDDVAKSFNVSRSTFKRICRDNGIPKWPHPRCKIDKVNDSLSMQDPPPQDGQATVAHTRLSAAVQDGRTDIERRCSAAVQDGRTDIERRCTSHPPLVDNSFDLMGECITILNNIEGINDTVYSKALKVLHDDYGWRKIFLDIPAHRRKGWVLSL